MIWLLCCIAVFALFVWCMCVNVTRNSHLDEKVDEANERTKRVLAGEQEWRNQNDN